MGILKKFKAGSSRPGCKVLKMKRDSQISAEIIYLVEHACCGEIFEISHAELILKKSLRCHACTQARASSTARRGVQLISEIPYWERPKRSLSERDIERHLALVFRGAMA